MAIYIGKAPLTLVRTQHGSVEYVYAGQPAPGGIDRGDLRRLLDEEFLVELVSSEAVAELAAPDLVTDRPPLTAAKDVWVDYRRTQGVPDDALVGLTKAELQDDEAVAGLRPQP